MDLLARKSANLLKIKNRPSARRFKEVAGRNALVAPQGIASFESKYFR
jgi:hypothetical protein